MQKETKNILWVAVGSFFSGVIMTFALLCLAVAMTRPCHKDMGPMPMPGMHEQGLARHMEMSNRKHDLKGPRHAKKFGERRPDKRDPKPEEPTAEITE